MKYLLFIFSMLLLTSCELGTGVKSSSGVKKATTKVTTGSDGLTVEQRNIAKRLSVDNELGAIKHLYVISAMSGQVILYSWDRLDKQQYNQWRAEITGIKASYNKIVKEYNAQSSKFNWTLYNTSNLPRSYQLYIDN